MALRPNRITNRGLSPLRPGDGRLESNVPVPLPSPRSRPPTSHSPRATVAGAVGVTPQSTPRQTLNNILEQQVQLQEKTEKILSFIETSQGSTVSGNGRRKKIPKELSGLVHEVYQEMQMADEAQEWNLSVNFDHSSNKTVNREITQNVRGLLTGEDHYSSDLIKRAARTYFKTLKNKSQRENRGIQTVTKLKQRRRQRMINKSIARKKVLQSSTSLSTDEKAKIEPLLLPDYMSSDESVANSISDTDNSDAEDNVPLLHVHQQRKKLLKKKASWRSPEFQDYISSLDRKIERRRTERGKAMALEVTMSSSESSRSAPDGCPDWAKSLFD